MPKCSECKYRRKIKEPNGGLMTKGRRVCLKNKTTLNKLFHIDPVTRQIFSGYPAGCDGNGIAL